MQSGRVDNRIPLKLLINGLVASKSSSIYSLSIAVKLPPKMQSPPLWYFLLKNLRQFLRHLSHHRHLADTPAPQYFFDYRKCIVRASVVRYKKRHIRMFNNPSTPVLLLPPAVQPLFTFPPPLPITLLLR